LSKSKIERILKQLKEKGWGVTDCGHVVKPDMTIRDTTVKHGVNDRPDYLVFTFKFEGMSYPVPVHKLAAYQKYGDEVFSNQVRHLDGLSLNNDLDNIAIGTGSDNMMDRPAEDRRLHAIKAASTLRRFKSDEVKYIRSCNSSGNCLAKELGVSKSTISYIRNYKLYTDVD
jgi:hypothetical protein